MTERSRPPDVEDAARRAHEARGGSENPRPGIRAVFFSAVTTEACEQFAKLGPGYWAFFTADPNPAYAVTDEQIRIAKSGNGLTGAWCDCATTFMDAAEKMRAERGLYGTCGQFEDDAQWDEWMEQINPESHFAIGNPSALNPANLAEAIDISTPPDESFLIGEVMYPDPSYSAMGVNIASACFYIDRDEAQGGYLPLKAYEVMPAAMRRTCSVYTGGAMTAEDWATYRAWTQG